MEQKFNNEVEKNIFSTLNQFENKEDRDILQSFGVLRDLEYESQLSPDAINQIIAAIEFSLQREYRIFKPYREIYNLLRDLSVFHAKEFATIQDVITAKLDLELLDYEEFSSALYFFSDAWKNLASVWTDENKTKIIEHLIEIIEEEYEENEEFDAFIADDVLRGLIKIGQGHPKSQEIIEWVEKILDEEEEDDDE